MQRPAPLRPAPFPSEQTPAAARGTVKPTSPDRFSVNFTADFEFKELLEEVRALASHGQANDSLMSLMKLGLQALRSELLKKRFGVGRKSRRTQQPPQRQRQQGETAKHTRHVPAAVAREVYERDGGRCTFCSDDGRRCGTRELLQFDHITSHADGGESTLENLRLRCRAHNLHAAEQRFGAQYVRQKVARAQGRKRRQSERGDES